MRRPEVHFTNILRAAFAEKIRCQAVIRETSQNTYLQPKSCLQMLVKLKPGSNLTKLLFTHQIIIILFLFHLNKGCNCNILALL